jgi:hypothetical protein
MADCFDCGRGYYGGGAEGWAVGHALVFPSYDYRQEVIGTQRRCYTSSSVSCTPDGNCKEEPGAEICDDVPRYFYWRQLNLDVLDLANPDAPALRAPVKLDGREDADSVIASGNELLESFRVPLTVPMDPRPYVRWFVRSIDLSDPAAPSIGDGVNVPGAVIAVDGDEYVTRDQSWSDSSVSTSVARVKVEGARARLVARHTFADDYVSEIVLDGAGHVLVSHRTVDPDVSWNDVKQQVTVLSARSLGVISTTDVDSWATLQAAVAGRALFGVPGGMLVMNLDDAAAPYAQAYFPMGGWPYRVVQAGRDVYFPAGRFGIVRFDLDEINLGLR